MASSRAFCVIVLCFIAELTAGQVLQLDTPLSLTQCEPVELVWQGGTPPYALAIVSGSSSQGAVLQQFADLTGNSFIWSTDVTAGTSVALEMSDSEGNLSQTNAIVVHSSSNQSCLNDGTSKSSSTTVIATDATTSTAGNAQTTGSAQPPSATSSPSPTQSFAGSISRSGTSSQSNPTSVSNGSPSLTLQNTSSPGMSTSTPVLVPTGANTTPKSSRSLGRVVGAAVGGSIGGLLLILLAVLILRRRIRRRRIQEIEGQRRRASRALLDTTEPFISIPEKGSKTDVSSLPVTTRTPTNTRSAPSPPSANVDPPPGPSSVPTRNELQQPSATVPRREPAVRTVRREVDAGSVHMDEASDEGGTLTLPPAYEDLPPRQRRSRRRPAKCDSGRLRDTGARHKMDFVGTESR